MSHDPNDADPTTPRRSVAGSAATVPTRGVPASGRRPDSVPVPEVSPVDVSTRGVPVIPPEQKVLDPRAIARESLTARRNTSLWVVLAGVVLAAVVSVLTDGSWGALTLAALLAAAAVVRAVVPEPAPVALAVRARALDVALLTGLAVAIGALSQAIPLS